MPLEASKQYWIAATEDKYCTTATATATASSTGSLPMQAVLDHCQCKQYWITANASSTGSLPMQAVLDHCQCKQYRSSALSDPILVLPRSRYELVSSLNSATFLLSWSARMITVTTASSQLGMFWQLVCLSLWWCAYHFGGGVSITLVSLSLCGGDEEEAG